MLSLLDSASDRERFHGFSSTLLITLCRRTCRSVELFLSVFLISIAVSDVNAQDMEFDAANKLYEKDNYQVAAESYESLIAAGKSSSAVYFNLGNSYFRMNRTGKAITNFLRAQSLSPRDPDIKANLEFARDQVVRPSPPRTPIYVILLSTLTLKEWFRLCFVTNLLFFLLLGLGEWRPDWKPSLRIPAIVSFVMLFGMVAVVAAAYFVRKAAPDLVVTAPKASAHYGPMTESQEYFILNEGEELKVQDKKSGWLKAKSSDGRSGWIQGSDAEWIDPSRNH
ncbi:MAG TPA: tetratricopeptide repeat protein [Verrucomicrobiales bacterium]|nr:tetratricopeptide repeat protein [Verrucomicrobiales bacterium]HIL70681.1 tetratricopeptide repeat protein [Verrucomicrobiota bacterium]